MLDKSRRFIMYNFRIDMKFYESNDVFCVHTTQRCDFDNIVGLPQ